MFHRYVYSVKLTVLGWNHYVLYLYDVRMIEGPHDQYFSEELLGFYLIFEKRFNALDGNLVTC